MSWIYTNTTMSTLFIVPPLVIANNISITMHSDINYVSDRWICVVPFPDKMTSALLTNVLYTCCYIIHHLSFTSDKFIRNVAFIILQLFTRSFAIWIWYTLTRWLTFSLSDISCFSLFLTLSSFTSDCIVLPCNITNSLGRRIIFIQII